MDIQRNQQQTNGAHSAAPYGILKLTVEMTPFERYVGVCNHVEIGCRLLVCTYTMFSMKKIYTHMSIR